MFDTEKKVFANLSMCDLQFVANVFSFYPKLGAFGHCARSTGDRIGLVEVLDNRGKDSTSALYVVLAQGWKSKLAKRRGFNHVISSERGADIGETRAQAREIIIRQGLSSNFRKCSDDLPIFTSSTWWVDSSTRQLWSSFSVDIANEGTMVLWTEKLVWDCKKKE